MTADKDELITNIISLCEERSIESVDKMEIMIDRFYENKYKESSKELVEALRYVVSAKDESIDINSFKFKTKGALINHLRQVIGNVVLMSEKALENHLK